MKLLGLGIAILVTACMINGKSIGPGGGGGTTSGNSGNSGSSGNSGTSTTSSSGGGEDNRYDGDKYRGATKYGYGPSDPWAAVDGDQPRQLPDDKADHWVVRGDDYACTAAHDHCIDPLVWFTIRDSDVKHGLPNTVGMNIFGTEGNDHLYSPVNSTYTHRYGGDAFVAYRTVPATKTNIGVGSLVVALDRSAGKLGSAQHAYEASWWIGEVEEIDIDGGFYKLKNRDDVFKLWGARPVVLIWQKGGKVQIVGNKKRDQLAVKATDVFLPD